VEKCGVDFWVLVGYVETQILETDDEVSDHWQKLRYNILVDDYVDADLDN